MSSAPAPPRLPSPRRSARGRVYRGLRLELRICPRGLCLHFPSYACCSRPASSLSIESIVSITRFALAGSPPPPSKLPSWFGMICHDNPNLSLSHPQRLGDPPSAVSLSQSVSISC